jgi:uncharacterized protein (UPF0333 family)
MAMNKHFKYIKKLHDSEKGYAAFVITLVTIILITLIVVAFTADSRFEQKDSLANALSSQAYYAAESGINDAYAQIEALIDSNQQSLITNTAIGDCTPSELVVPPAGMTPGSNSLSGQNVKYSCLSINTTPNSLFYQSVDPGDGLVIPAIDSNGNNISTLTVSWQTSNTPTPSLLFTGCPTNESPAEADLQPYSSYTCSAGVLQLDITSGSAVGSSSVTASSYSPPSQTTVFLQPVSNLGVANKPAASPSQDLVYPVSCNRIPYTGEKFACSATLDLSGDSTYYLRLQTFYAAQDVNITATDTSGGAVNFAKSQILIDSTGEAGGQLKRIEERVCDNQFCGNGAPVGAIQSTQCIDKQYDVYPGGGTAPSC